MYVSSVGAYFLVHGPRGVLKQREIYGIRGRSQAPPHSLFSSRGAGHQQKRAQGHSLPQLFLILDEISYS